MAESQVSEDELACLLSHAGNADIVVEIGCYEGKTTAALAGCGVGRVYSIDPFIGGRLGVCYGELIAKHTCRRRGLDNVEFIRAFSYDAAPEFRESIDLLFMDADHSYEAVKRDWEDWRPKVRSGGIIALHDCRLAPSSPDYLGSMKFYDQYLRHVEGVQELAGVGSLAVFKITV